MAVATSENTSFGVHEWNQIRSYTEKQNFCFFYAFICNNLASTCSSTLTSRKQTFSSHFTSILFCLTCLGVKYGWKRSFAPRKWPQIVFKAIQRKKSVKKKCHSHWQSAWRRVQKKRYVSTISVVSGSIAERWRHRRRRRNFRHVYSLHLILLGKPLAENS